MEGYRTEEEQVAALKKWWKDNGNSLLIGIGLALFLIFGWKSWQQWEVEQKAAASSLYQELLEAQFSSPDPDTAKGTTQLVAGKLKDEYQSSEYAGYAALFLAKEAVNASDYETAIAELQWYLDNRPESPMHTIVKTRIAKVKAAQGDYSGALAALPTTVAPSMVPLVKETEGDILLANGQSDEALAAYQTAKQELVKQDRTRPLLDIKLADLGKAGDS